VPVAKHAKFPYPEAARLTPALLGFPPANASAVPLSSLLVFDFLQNIFISWFTSRRHQCVKLYGIEL
jgi:hypothetical protein